MATMENPLYTDPQAGVPMEEQPPARILTPQQAGVVEWALRGSGHLLLVARAGAAKTTTAVEVAKYTPYCEKFLGSFGKRSSQDLYDKLVEARVVASAMTLHKVGKDAWERAVGGRLTISKKHRGGKVDLLVEALGEQWEAFHDLLNNCGGAMWWRELVGLGKRAGIGWNASVEDMANWVEVMELFGHRLPQGITMAEVMPGLAWVYQTSLNQCVQDRTVDFDDMLLAPLVYGVAIPQFDWVISDEHQDSNHTREELLVRMVRPGTGRMIAVGDQKQSIFSFSGALPDAMDRIAARMQMATAKLSVSFRLPRAGVAFARQWVPDLEAWDGAREGLVREGEAGDIVNEVIAALEMQERGEWARETLAIVCRNNRPLVEMAFRLVRAQVKCKVEGREIGARLIQMATQWCGGRRGASGQRLEEMEARLKAWARAEVRRLKEEKKKWRIGELVDQVEVILWLGGELRKIGAATVGTLVGQIEKLFEDSEPEGDGEGEVDTAARVAVILTTIHKAKGLEWTRVWWLGKDEYQPSKWAQTPMELEQEGNLEYVAGTREKEELVVAMVGQKDRLGESLNQNWLEKAVVEV